MANLFTPLPPSGLIEEILENLNVTCDEFAERLGIELNFLKQVIEGKHPITADLALRLEAAVENPSAEAWLRMQAQYDMRMAILRTDLSQIKPYPPLGRLSSEKLKKEQEKLEKAKLL